MLSIIIAFLGGVLACSGLIISRLPDAKDLIDKIAPYQGFIGAAILFWGVWGIIQSILNLSHIGAAWGIGLGIAVVEFIVGFLLAYSLLSQYLFKGNPEAEAKGQQLRSKLINYQVPAGATLIVLAIVALVL